MLQEGPISAKFANAQMYEQLQFLIKNSTKITTARISVKEGDHTTWYSLFTSTLEGIIEKYNEDNNEADTIEEIDEDKLL